MSERSSEELEHQEIEMLLPWYATGRLDPDDIARVEAYLDTHPQAARQLDLARAERDQTVAANEDLGAPSAAATERIMATLPAARPGLGAVRALTGGLHRIGSLIAAPPARAVRWAAVAAVALIAVQAVAIVTLLEQRTATFQGAGGGQTDEGITLLVVFADDATASAISRFLEDLDARIVDGPRAGGIYRIRLRTEDRSPTAREALVRRLTERRDVVRAVVPGKP